MTNLLKLFPLLIALALLAGVPPAVSGQGSVTVQFERSGSAQIVQDSSTSVEFCIEIQGSPAPDVPVSVDLSYTDPSGLLSDGSDIPSTVTFQVGETRICITAITNVVAFEAEVNFTLANATPSDKLILGTQSSFRLRVVNLSSFVLGFSRDIYTVPENAGSVDVTVTLNRSLPFLVSVEISTYDITADSHLDYVPVVRILPFFPGETSKSVSIDLIDDVPVEPNFEEFGVRVEGVAEFDTGQTQSAVVRIQDDDTATIQFLIDKTTAAEGDIAFIYIEAASSPSEEYLIGRDEAGAADGDCA